MEKINHAIEKKEIFREVNTFPIENDELKSLNDSRAPKWNLDHYKDLRKDDPIPLILESAELEKSMMVVDMMCGTANILKKASETYPDNRYFAVDFSIGMLNQVAEGFERVCANVKDLPFKNGLFDRVFLRSGLFDLPVYSQLKAISEIKRTMKKGGIFMLQTYYTEDETQDYYNHIVNRKDLAAGKYKYMGKDQDGKDIFPRYFATLHELENWFTDAGFDYSPVKSFEGTIRYMATDEMFINLYRHDWISYMDRIPSRIKEKIRLRTEEGIRYVYDFPGIIYKLTNN